jgi:DNA-binding transcriptional ArsR family regulator
MRGPAVRTDLDQTLTALADPARRAIVELLRERPLRPSEVADVLARVYRVTAEKTGNCFGDRELRQVEV